MIVIAVYHTDSASWWYLEDLYNILNDCELRVCCHSSTQTLENKRT